MRGEGTPPAYLTALRRRLETKLARTPGLQATAPGSLDLGDDRDLPLCRSPAGRDLLDGAGDHLADVGLGARLGPGARPREGQEAVGDQPRAR